MLRKKRAERRLWVSKRKKKSSNKSCRGKIILEGQSLCDNKSMLKQIDIYQYNEIKMGSKIQMVCLSFCGELLRRMKDVGIYLLCLNLLNRLENIFIIFGVC